MVSEASKGSGLRKCRVQFAQALQPRLGGQHYFGDRRVTVARRIAGFMRDL